MIAEVLINSIAKELNKTFDYIVPNSLIKEAKIGTRVLVPFGKTKVEEGYVIELKEKSEYAAKEILKVTDHILTEENISLAKLMARRYFCNISDCIKLMLPPGNTSKVIEKRIKEKTGNFIYLKKDREEIEFDIESGKLKSEKQIKLLNFLSENDGTYISDLEIITEVSKAVMKTLEKKGYIEIVEKQILRNPFINKKIKKDKPHILTKEQQDVYNTIVNSSSNNNFLIFGITGSRKD